MADIGVKLSVIIVNWNTRELLARCLDSVHSDLPADSEVWVVDNASTDGSAAMVHERFPWVHPIENNENVGFARANNQALHRASGGYLLLLNSDTEVRPGAFQTLIDLLDRHPEAGVSGPRMLNPDGSLQNSYGSLPTVVDELLGPYWADFLTKPWGALGRRLSHRPMGSDTPRTVDRVSFACTMIRRSALDQVGLLDEGFEFYSEDYDWFKRLKDAGWKVLYCPQAEITHHWGASSSQRNEWALKQLYRSKRLYFAKHYGPGSEILLRAGLTCRFVLKLTLAAVRYPIARQESSRQLARYWLLSRDMVKGFTP